MKTIGEALRLAGLVGLVSPWLPDPGDHAASDDLTGWALLGWLATCAALVALGCLLAERAERGHWPCWLLFGHRYGGMDNGWIVCRRCRHGELIRR